MMRHDTTQRATGVAHGAARTKHEARLPRHAKRAVGTRLDRRRIIQIKAAATRRRLRRLEAAARRVVLVLDHAPELPGPAVPSQQARGAGRVEGPGPGAVGRDEQVGKIIILGRCLAAGRLVPAVDD